MIYRSWSGNKENCGSIRISYPALKDKEPLLNASFPLADRKKTMFDQRIFVVYKNIPVMPMKFDRACRFVEQGKALFRVHQKLEVLFIELLEEPSGFKQQDINLGFDPGSKFDGISVVSKYCHHENFELIHNKDIKKRMDVRRKNRRHRRSRLRNRPARFSFRTAKKMVPTIKSMYDFRVDFISKLLEIVPISGVVIERNAFNFYEKNYGKNANHAMQGLNKLIDYMKSRTLKIIERVGHETKKHRTLIFGEDKKIKQKDAKSFFAHCIDSYALATIPLENGIELTRNGLKTKTRFIKKIHHIRRQLHLEQKKHSTKHRPNQHLYRKYRKGGIAEYLDPYYGKRAIIRVEKFSGSFRELRTIDQGRALKYHKFKKAYGGTVYYGINKWSVYRHVETGETVLPTGEAMCKKIRKDKNNYRLIGYKRWSITVVK